MIALTVAALLGVVGLERPAIADLALQSVCPVVGVGALVAGTDPVDGVATNATLSYPYGLAVSPIDDAMYVSERNWDNDPYSTAGRGRIRRISSTGQISQVVLGPTGNTRLGRLAISNDGSTLYVAANQSPPATHLLFSVDLTAPTPAMTLVSTFGNEIFDLAVSPTTGNLYIATRDNIVIERLPDGSTRTVAGGGVDSSSGIAANLAVLTGPISVAFAPDGDMVLGVLRRVRRVVPAATSNPYGDGLISTIAAAGGSPDISGNGAPALLAGVGDVVDVTVAADDTVYIGGQDAHTIRRIDAVGNQINAVAGSSNVTTGTNAGIAGFADGSGTAARFSQTTELVAHDGVVDVVDARNNRIRRITPGVDEASTVVTTIAGNGPNMVDDTGAALTRQVGLVRGVAGGIDGSMYFGDRDGHRVWRRAADGSMSVVAGTGQYRPAAGAVVNGLATSVRLGEIKDIAIDRSGGGTLYVLERTRVFAIDLTSLNLTVLAGSGGLTEGPDGVATATTIDTGARGSITSDPSGVYISGISESIRRISGGSITTVQTMAAPILSLESDLGGNLFVGTTGPQGGTTQRIWYLDSLGTLTSVVGAGDRGETDGPAASALLYNPEDLAFAQNGGGTGTLYFTQASGRVRALRPAPVSGVGAYSNGTVVTIAGSVNNKPFGPGEWGDGVDLSGDPAGARLNSPTDIAWFGGTLVVVDEFPAVSDTTNTGPEAIRMITDAGCGEVRFGDTFGTVGTATANGVSLSSLPIAQIAFDTNAIAAMPMRAVPMRAVELDSSPMRAVPMRAVPLSAIPMRAVGLADTPFGSSAISSLVLDSTKYPGGWPERLEGTPWEGQAPQSVRLADLVDDPAVGGDQTSVALTRDPPVTLADIDLSTSPIRAVSLASLALGSTPMRAVPLSPELAAPGATDAQRFAAWCDLLTNPAIPEIASLGLTCTGLGLTPESPLLALDVHSVPMRAVPMRAVPMRAVDLSASPMRAVPMRAVGLEPSPLRTSPMRAVPMRAVAEASAALRAVPMRAVPMRAVDLNASPIRAVQLSLLGGAVDDVVSCWPACETLGEAADADVILPTATIGDLLPALDAVLSSTGAAPTLGDLRFSETVPFAGSDTDDDGDIDRDDEVVLGDIANALPEEPFISLADVLAGLIAAPDLPWEDIDLSKTGIDSVPGAGSSWILPLTFRLYPSQTGTVPITVTLPPTWKYQATGPFTVDPDAAAPTSAAVPTPQLGIDPGTGAQTVTYTVPAGLPSPSTVSVSITAYTGTVLGPAQAHVTVGPVLAGGATRTVAGYESLVEDLDEAAVNSFDDARDIAPDTLYFSYLNEPGDVDYYAISAGARGAITRLSLSHLPVDADLAVYSVDGSDFNFRDGVAKLRQQSKPIEMVEPQASTIGEPLEPQELQDIPLEPGRKVAAVSARRGTATESVELINDTVGASYVIAVTGYNGAASTSPYMLRAARTTPPGGDACTAADLPLPDLPGGYVTTPEPGPLPSGTKSLILANRDRLTRLYGTAAAEALLAELQTFAARSDVGGTVVLVDGVPAVRAAYSTWAADPCGLRAPNNVVRAVNDVVDDLLTPALAGTVENMVLVGSDEQLPMARLIDNTKLSNELEYGSELRRDGVTSTPQTVALASRSLLSDDPYGSLRPRLFGPDVIYPPDLAIGRLVETPAEIGAVIDQYSAPATNGRLNPDSTLTTGYDFLSDGADAVDAALANAVPATAGRDRSLVNDTWTAAQLGTKLLPSGAAPDIVSLNAHFDHHRLLPAEGDTNSSAPLFSTSALDAVPGKLAGRVLLSMGCHSGIGAPDYYLGSSTGDARDWAQVLAAQQAVWVANTGYGYGDTATVAYSERLMAMFAARLGNGERAGEALRLAKQAYLGGGLGNSYDAKSLSQVVFYGLPMYRVGSGTPVPPAPTYVPTAPDPSAGGLPSHTQTVSPTLHVSEEPDGSKYVYADDASQPGQLARSTQVVDGRPIQPRMSVDVTAPGLEARGAVITDMTMSVLPNFPVSVARPVVDLTDREPAVSASDMIYPSAFQNVTTYEDATGTRNGLVLVPGQWRPDAIPNNAPNVGEQRKFDSMTSTVYYALPGDTDDVQPTITTTSGTASGGGVTFRAEVSDRTATGDGTVRRVVVLYLDGSEWRSTELAESTPGSGQYVGGGPASVDDVDYLLQAVDASGNVGVSSNKAQLFTSVAAPTGGGGVNGSPVVTAAAAAPASAFQPVTLLGTFTDADGSTTWSGTGNTGAGGVVPLVVTGDAFSATLPGYASPGTYTITVSLCDGEGACGTRTTTVTIASTGIAPTVDCTIVSFGKALVWWGTQSGAASSLTLPVGVGNSFNPAPVDVGQPTLVDPGGTRRRFATLQPFVSRSSWSLGGVSTAALDGRGCGS